MGLPPYEYCNREQLYQVVISQQKLLRNKDAALARKRPEHPNIAQRYIELEKLQDALIQHIFDLETQLAELNGTEPPNFTIMRDYIIRRNTVDKHPPRPNKTAII